LPDRRDAGERACDRRGDAAIGEVEPGGVDRRLVEAFTVALDSE